MGSEMCIRDRLISKHFPDWRRVLNECQRYSVSGKIDSGILVTFSDVAVNDVVKNLKDKNFWVYAFDGEGDRNFIHVVGSEPERSRHGSAGFGVS